MDRGLAQGERDFVFFQPILLNHLYWLQVLHFLYDKDVLEDSVILDWMGEDGEDEAVKKKMRNKCKAFIQWLEEADSESEED